MKKVGLSVFLTLLVWTFGLGQKMSDPIRIAQMTNGVRWSQIAFTPDGIAHIIWEEDTPTPAHDIMYVSYDGKTISTPINLRTTPDGRGERPYIAAGPTGTIAVVWGMENSAYLRIYDPVEKKWKPQESVKLDYGGDEPCVAVDIENNIWVWWYSDRDGRVYSRAKIGGAWEETKRLSSPTVSKQGGIVAGKDGWIWAVWREKQGGGEYKLRYSKRKKDTNWTALKDVNDAGASASHPHIAMGPDNIPWVATGDIDESTGNDQEMWVIKLDEKTNPRELAINLYLQHYPRIAVDRDGVRHVACAIGGGDYGDGVRYANNAGGKWKDPQTFGAVWPKLPGISHDGFGNIGICWSSMNQEGYTRIFFSSLYPVSKKVFYPPTKLNGGMTFDPNDATKFTYNFSWEANSQNNDKDLEGYRIYKKDGDALEALVTVSKSTTSASLTFTEFKETLQFGITTVATSGSESEMVLFEISYPQIYAPAGLVATISLSKLRTAPGVSYNLSWQANSQNTDAYVKEYRIYLKESGGSFALLTAVSKSTYTYTVAFSDLKKRRQFGMTAVSVLNKESAMATF